MVSPHLADYTFGPSYGWGGAHALGKRNPVPSGAERKFHPRKMGRFLGQNPWENYGKMVISWAKPWENHGKMWAKPWENHGKIWWFPGQNHGKTMGKWWFHGQNHGKTMGKCEQNHGKIWWFPGQNHGKTMGKIWWFQGIISYDLPSGNLLHDYGTSPFFWWEKSPISMAMFKFAFCMFTRPGNTLMDCDEKLSMGFSGPPRYFCLTLAVSEISGSEARNGIRWSWMRRSCKGGDVLSVR